MMLRLPALLLLAGLLAAADLAPVRVEAPPPAALRPGAPIPLVLEVASRGGLASGRLHLALGEEGEAPLATWTSDEVVVDGSGRRLDLLLPALDLPRGHDALVAQARWLDAAGAHVLPPFDLGLPRRGQPRLVAAIACLAETAPVVAPERTIAAPNSVRTTVRTLDPAELPADAAAWCAWDLAVLDREALARLTAAQRQAAAAWVGAGGALWLLGGGLPAELAALVEADAGRQAAPDKPARLRCGLGRVVAGRGDHHGDLAHLWRLPVDADSDPFVPDKADPWRQPLLQQVAGRVAQGLTASLPLGAILGCFALFALWITAGEFWLLRRWGLRRWTWLTLPAAAALTGGAVLLLALRALDSAAGSRRLEVVDVGAQGRILRRTVIEVRITARSGVVRCTEGALWRCEPLSTFAYGFAHRPRSTLPPPRIVGTRSTHAEVDLPRWTPVILAASAVGGGQDASGLGGIATLDQAQEARDRLLAAAGPGSMIRLAGDDDAANQPSWIDIPNGRPVAVRRGNPDGNHGITHIGFRPGPLRGADHRDLLLLAPEESELLTVITLTTPTPDGWIMRRRVVLRDQP